MTKTGKTFTKIHRQSVTEQVFAALRQDIQSGVFVAGDRLPSEAVLSETMGVSKATIKAAVQRLITLGLVESRKGEGIFVLEFDVGQYLAQMSEFLLDEDDIRYITEYRLYSEMAAVRLAVRNATEENFRRMEEHLSAMEHAVAAGDWEECGRHDYEFHLEICRATGNKIFVLAYKVIGKMLMRHAMLMNRSFFEAVRRHGAKDDIHSGLMEAIRAGDLDRSRKEYARMFAMREPLAEEVVRGS